MSTTILSDYSWFYNIIQAQTLVLGYGITTRADPWDRLMEYSRSCAAKQQFCNLYYGKTRQIIDLERYVKSQWNKYRLDEFSDRKLEWLDPKWKIEVIDLENFVADQIINYPYDTIRKVKTEFLPFSVDNQGVFQNISTNPNFFLEEVRLTKKRK
jgi:hypothetical protein